MLEAVTAGECVLFAGSGLLVSTGYPPYSQTLLSVLAQLERRSPGQGWSELRARAADDPDVVTELIRARQGEDELQGMLLDLISKVDPGTPATLRALTDIPLSGVVTDDWSGSVLRVFGGKGPRSVTPWRTEGVAEVLRSGRFFVVEAAGGVAHGRVLITPTDYLNALQSNRDYARLMAGVVATRSLLFIGASLASIEQFWRNTELRGSGDPEHWALIPWQPELATKTELLRVRYGVHCIVYSPSLDPDAATAEFAERLAEVVPRGAAPARLAASKADRLERVELRNIGPFDELTLDFAGQGLDELAAEIDLPGQEREHVGRRTILLGDNGSGKSSVLRAIALSLAGESALSARTAQRILKTRASSGDITLTLDGVAYRTRLLRDGPRVRIESARFTPAQTATWLAIGFPAMRGVTTGNPQGPTTDAAGDPTPDDLMPLLEDGPDSRLDDLKQWVINTEVRSKDPARPDAERQGEMLKRFFDILGDLTPGVDFEYAGVDQDAWEVRLDSPDGMISFDLLSRGMTAILGWIGVLLQRLYEVHADAARPEAESALLLVDEIDVHLHPEWQHEILPLLEKHFPAVQLLATTHSALVVGNVRPLDVIVLRRDFRNVVRPTRIDGRFAGWRSDQILTSPAFGLTSTRDAATASDQAEYRELMAQGRTPDNDERAAMLFARLEARLPPDGETPHAWEGAELLREWLEERLESRPDEERRMIIGEALVYLERMRTGSDR